MHLDFVEDNDCHLYYWRDHNNEVEYRKRPYETMAILEEQLVRAYFPKLSPQLRANYKKCIGEIMRCLTECEGYEGKRMNETLKPNYLLGYYLQRNELYKKKTQEEEQK